MDRLRTLTLDIGDCRRCQACSGLGPDYIVWDATLDLPFVTDDQVPEDLARELVAYCPGGCISLEDDEGQGG